MRYYVETFSGEFVGYFEAPSPANAKFQAQQATGKHGLKATPAQVDEGKEAFNRICGAVAAYYAARESAADLLADDGGIGRDFMAECLEGTVDTKKYWAEFEASTAKTKLTQQLVDAAEQYREEHCGNPECEGYYSRKSFDAAVEKFVEIVPELPERWWTRFSL